MMGTREAMGERELIALWVRMAAYVLMTLMAVSLPHCMYRDYERGRALERGADPIGVACVYGTAEQNDACALAAAKTTRDTQ